MENDGVEKGRWRSKAFRAEGVRDDWSEDGGGRTHEMNEGDSGMRIV